MVSSSQYCLNCQGSLDQGDRFCRGCGQSVSVHRFTLAHIFHEFFHAFTHADKSVFGLIKDLATRPGKLVAAYLDGRRKSIFNPFTFLLLVAALSMLVLGLTKNPAPVAPPGNKMEKVDSKTLGIQQRARYVSEFMAKRQNLVMIVAVPFNALVFFLAFRKRGRNYAEHLVANLFFVGGVILLTSLLFYPLMALFNRPPALFIVLGMMLLTHCLYYCWAYAQFFSIRSAKGIVGVFLVSVLSILLWSSLTRAVIHLYIMG